MNDLPAFSRFSENYTEVLNRALSVTGGERETYAKARVDFLRARMGGGRPVQTILDFGCGDGATCILLKRAFSGAAVAGADISGECLRQAENKWSAEGIRFIPAGEMTTPNSFDLIYVNGVFHHIPQRTQDDLILNFHRLLKPSGILAVFENNPWNPGTRWVMNRIPFDRGAVMISPSVMKRRILSAGFSRAETKFLFTLPPFTGFLFRFDRYFQHIPLGGQYAVVAWKAS
jgi:SAM-dependent methyltransferase